jgi:hypothetical protein
MNKRSKLIWTYIGIATLIALSLPGLGVLVYLIVKSIP